MIRTPRYLIAFICLAIHLPGAALAAQSPRGTQRVTTTAAVGRTRKNRAERVNRTRDPAARTGSGAGDAVPERAGEGESDVRPRLLDEPFRNPQQLLRLLDIGPSDFDSFVDGQPISEADEEAFLKILFRMPRLGLDNIARWSRDEVPWATLRADPGHGRGNFFEFRGRVRKLVPVSVRPEMADLFALDQYFEAQVEVAEEVWVTVCTRNVPQAWRDHGELDERCRVSAMFLKQAAPVGDRVHFLFAAPRIAWIPDQVDPTFNIGPDQVLLGNLGMDVGLFDAVRSRNGLPINAAERECFYALLHAVGQAQPAQLTRHATEARLNRLLQHPERLHGKALRVPGSVQRITRVVVEEEDIAQRYGIRYYYQLDVLVSLDDVEVRLETDRRGKAGPVYRTHFPFTCCALSIPDQWQRFVGKEQAGPHAVLHGFFYKLWSYSNPYVSSFDPTQRQPSPMLIVHAPKPTEGVKNTNGSVNIVIGLGFLMVLALIWLTIWWLNRADRQHASPLLQERFSPANPNFEHLQEGDESVD
ncbi:MAG: hypothetical protein ACODAD_02270 [Planctomycetota bacterium]